MAVDSQMWHGDRLHGGWGIMCYVGKWVSVFAHF